MNKRRKRRNTVRYLTGAVVFLLVLIIFGVILIIRSKDSGEDGGSVQTGMMSVSEAEAVPVTEVTSDTPIEQTGETAAPFVVYPERTKGSKEFSSEYDAEYAVLIDAETNEIVSYRNSSKKMYPASLTKVMTLIVAVENNSDLSETIQITSDMVDPFIWLDASRAGFLPGETPTVEDTLYGMILMSGADAALAVAVHTSGSEEAFVELMNEKAEQMGLKNTHFTNTVGLHDEDNYSTAEDMALILEYALRDKECRDVLSAVEYKVAPTEQNPEGLTFESTLFSRMYGDEMPNVIIQGGKTGYTDESGNCIETFAEVNGRTYILVFAGGKTRWNMIYDTLSAYSVYCAGGDPYVPPAR